MDDLENRHSRFELTALLDTSRLLIESHDLTFILNNLVLNLMGKLMVGKAAVFMYHHREKNYQLKTLKGRSKLQKGDVLNWNAQSHLSRPKLYQFDLEDAPEYLPEVFCEEKFCSFIPIMSSNQFLGFIALGGKINRQPFSKREIEFAVSLVIISSVAIANSRLFTDLKTTNRVLDRKVQELHTLFDISKEFNASVDREQMLKIFKFAVLGQMFIRTFFVIFKFGDQTETIVKNGLKQDIPEELIQVLFESVDDQVFVNEQWKSSFPFFEQTDVALLLPIYLQKEKYAILGLGNRANNEGFSASDLNFLHSLGNLLAMSIQKTYLMEERIEKERIEKELSIARTIQQRLIPKTMPKMEGFELAASNEPSRQVGGDYFDILPVGESSQCLAIADVTGKGIPASLIMANLQSMLHVLQEDEHSIEEKTANINDIIYKNTPPDIFITFFWGVLNLIDKTFSYVNAGHNPPILYRPSTDEFIELKVGGLILGALSSMIPYQKETIQLYPDDVLVMFTDGVTEARNPSQDEEYEEERLYEVIKRSAKGSAQEILDTIVNEVNDYCNFKPGDDLTLMVLKAI